MRLWALRTWAVITVCVGLTGWAERGRAGTVVDFEDLQLAPGTAASADATETPFVSRGVSFNRTWNQQFDCCPGGWAYSNQTDLTTPGSANSYSAYVLPDGSGFGGSTNYAVAFDSTDADATVTFPGPARVDGTYVTNTTYAYLAVVEGNDGAGFVKGPFADGDWFKLEITGLDLAGSETGTVDFYLVDYRDGKSFAASDWNWVDLTPLGDNVESLQFALSSTDAGSFGMNTPAYFAIDDLTYVPVPEPSTNILGILGAALLAAWGLRRA